jgi:gliding motility-associated-like protein
MKTITDNNYLGRILFAIIFLVGFNFSGNACSPLTVPNLISQAISGGNLNLQWQSTNTYNCTYSVQVELQCMGSAFTGTNPSTLFMSPALVKPSAAPANYPLQSITIGNLCPGTVYQFRAREVYAGSQFSGWTSTFTFTTPGTFTPPTINIAASSSTVCPPQVSSMQVTVSNTCGITPPTYAWAPATGLSCTNCPNPVASPSVTTDYTCTVSGGLLGCWTVNTIKNINVSSGSAILNTNATQSSCSNSVATATLSPAGSASVQTSITWNPIPTSVSANSLVATGLPVGITTITVFDQTGCMATTTLNILPAPPPVTFAINQPATLTCSQQSITMNASSGYTYGTLTYTWTSTSFTATGASVNIGQANSYNVCGMDAATQCSMCLTFTVTQDIAIPNLTVNPVTQIITCNQASPATFTNTAISPTVNLVHNWYSPLSPYPVGPPVQSDNNLQSIFNAVPFGPGTYTVELCNLVNGCCNTKTVSVTSISGFPTFNTSSTTNYSVGCTPLHQSTLCMVNAQSSNSAAVQFLFLPPGTPSAVPVSTTAFGAQSCTVLTTPGQWTCVVNDPSNGCQTQLIIPILQNTIAPHVLASFAPVSQTLTCFNPTILATGTSSTPGTVISWQVPSTPPIIPSSTIELGPSTGPVTHTNNLTYANYTVIASNTVNACQTKSVVIVSQNFRIPTPSLAISNPSVINCNGICPIISYTNNAAQSGVPGAIGQVTAWCGPAPSPCGPSSVTQYTACIAGVYTLTVRDSYNGCMGSKTYTILDRTQPPVMTHSPTVLLDCAAPSTTLYPTVSGGNGGHTIVYTYFPHDANFSPLGAVNYPIGVAATQSVFVDAIGTYSYLITNTVTGCQTIGTFEVVGGGLNADFIMDPSSGFAPLNVNFTNNSSTTASSSSITSLWSFGNGIAQTTTTSIQLSTTYNTPGTYTVMLLAKKGSCIDTAYKVIKVEIPSKLDIPNVFTPNDDGSNDLFFLKTQSIGEVTALIYDRWGNRVYEVTSNTGNIAWDGKNLQGKDCAAGTYFYIITATGKDSKEYSQKGNVSLYR